MTAEFAVALPALILLLLFAVGTVDAVLLRLRCVDAARDAALARLPGRRRRRGRPGTRAPAAPTITVWP